mgnify:CR=1 FL=1
MNSQSYYSRSEAAVILKVSATSITRYIKKGLLTSIEQSNRILIPCEEVHNFYMNNDIPTTVSPQQFEELKMEFQRLSADVEVLKLSLGVGKRFTILSDNDLLTILRNIWNLLKLEEWETKVIFEVCDIGMSLREQDIGRLILLKGTSSWNVLIDLLNRMDYYVRTIPITKNGIDLITARIEATKNRLYGMIYVQQSRIDSDAALWSKSVSQVESTDIFVLEFLQNRKYYNTN